MTGPSGPAPLLDLRQLIISLRWRKRVWLSCAVLGLLVGTVLAVFLPAPPAAVTRLLIVHENDDPNDGGSLIETDLALLDTVHIAQATLWRLGSAEDPQRFRKSYEATALTNNVAELTVTAPTATQARARARALAETFIADHVTRTEEAANATARALRDQWRQAQRELARVNDEIVAAAADPYLNPATLGSLYSRRADIASQVSDLSKRATEANIGAPRVAAGTAIVDPPYIARESATMTLATYGGAGLAFGLAAGLALAAMASVVRDRPVLRRDIADELGASVLAQLPLRRRGPARLLHRPRKGQRARIATTLGRALRPGDDTVAPVSLLELGCAPAAAELAVDTALALSGPVLVVDDLGTRHLTALVDRCGDSVRIVTAADYLSGAELPGPREQCLGVGSIGPGTAWTDLAALGRQTVLVVRAGHATAAWLHTVARQLADAGIAVIGIVLIQPYPRDRTDGTLWDGLHTALRGRLRAAEPSRNGRAPAPARQPEDVEV